MVRTFFGLLLAAVFGAGSASAQVTNGGFESADLGVIEDLASIDGWQLTVNADVDPPAVFEIVDDAQEGEKALKVTVAASGANPWHIEATAFPVTVMPDGTYQFSIWAKADEDGATATFSVGNQAFNEYAALRDNVDLTTEWQEFTFEFTITDEETEVRAPVHFSYAANVGNAIYIDGLSIVDPEAGATPIVVEAEDGDLGSEYATATDADAGVDYIDITTDVTETTGGAGFPGANRTATYEVTFDAPGWYDLFARVYVGASTFDDDSFFYANDFGDQDPSVADGWIVANQLAAAGFTTPDEFVSGLGAEGAEVWKWVNLSENNFNDVPADSFYVAPGELTHTFTIGARENGLLIDKLAFGRSDLFYTVTNLDNGEPGSVDAGEPIELPEQPLGAGLEKFIGNIYSPAQTEDFEFYWNYVIAENAGKWGSVEGTRDQFNWGGLDASYELAQENGLDYNFHVLTWGAQQPDWISGLEPAEQREEIREWMEAVAERYPDMDVVQVSNEVLRTHNPPDGQNGRADYKDAFGGDGDTGYDWVIEIFRMAREVFGDDQRLMLNDYGILSSIQAAQEYRGIIEDLQAEGLIDVIGVQGHAFSTRSGAPITAVLDLLGETGLPIQVTEFDVDGNPNRSAFVTEAQSDANQLRDMQRIFPLLWEHPSVEGITFWGWRPGLWRNEEEAYLVRSNGEQRPALDWLEDEYLPQFRVANEAEVDGAVRLLSTAPNPFSTSTRVSYELREAADVSLAVYDLLGRRVAVLADGPEAAGAHTATFEARGLASGTYLVRLQAGDAVTAVPVVVAR
ncbi:glycoside hydrolase [Rubrivirga marina]|uniref:Glycoside hydrolase n=1 Tax=Rubrivirga marina TaxID=1196024 RepID=A0A271J4Y7_9BACT|nr:glycoside hydrolase [Rubrivirga marina]